MRDRPIKVVSWNIATNHKPWFELAEMADQGEADLALLQEAGQPPPEIADRLCYENHVLDPTILDRWPLIVKLSDKVEVEWFRQVPAMGWWRGDREIEVSGIGTIAAARVVPRGRAEDAFLVFSMYARWARANPKVGKRPGLHADLSAHRILTDLQAFMNHLDPSRYPNILAAGDLNLCYGATEAKWYERECLVWDRFKSLGLEFLGPQLPNGSAALCTAPGYPKRTRDVPTYYTVHQGKPAKANRQLDYTFASRGFHKTVTVRAHNEVDDWGSSDHCRLLIEVG